MNKLLVMALLAETAIATPAAAQVVSLNFEGIASYPNNNDVLIQDYYNGGTSSIGTSGTNYGVSFGNNALLICLNSLTVTCSNTSRGGLAPTSAQGGLFFLSGSQTYLNYAAGFTTGFSFNYTAINQGGTIGVYDGLNGTGNLLTTITVGTTPSNCPGYDAAFCPFVAAGVAFTGTARSIGFGGVANQIVFDDITFGSTTPGAPVPEPATWALMVLGFGAVGYGMRRRVRMSNVKFDAKIKQISEGLTA